MPAHYGPLSTRIAALIGAAMLTNAGAADTDNRVPKRRDFQLNYAFSVDGLTAGQRVRIWAPVPTNSDAQAIAQHRFTPQPTSLATESRYGNRIAYWEVCAPANGSVSISADYSVRRMEVLRDNRLTKQRDTTVDVFLQPNRLVPIGGRPLSLLDNQPLPSDPLELARFLYDRVGTHMTYDKSKPGYGKGDVLWACDSRTGNCTDFHSLFISLARSQKIPARFEIGFPLPSDRRRGSIAGYHCWAWFHSQGKGWIPVDISEADKDPTKREYYFGNLSENRVAFTVGRDVELVPPSAKGPLNYFVYPHIEVGGAVWPKKKVSLTFAFEDQVEADVN